MAAARNRAYEIAARPILRRQWPRPWASEERRSSLLISKKHAERSGAPAYCASVVYAGSVCRNGDGGDAAPAVDARGTPDPPYVRTERERVCWYDALCVAERLSVVDDAQDFDFVWYAARVIYRLNVSGMERGRV